MAEGSHTGTHVGKWNLIHFCSLCAPGEIPRTPAKAGAQGAPTLTPGTIGGVGQFRSGFPAFAGVREG
jgi:hypothetical protein